MIDAGSTGSRVLAFSFHKSYLDGQLILDKELFEEIKPGLSSYAKDPKKVITTINSNTNQIHYLLLFFRVLNLFKNY